MWVPGYVGIRGSEVADSAAKDALDSVASLKFISYTDLKACVKKRITKLWQHERNEYSHNKLYKLILKLNERLPACQPNRGEETVLF